jgi:hypothetical protein
MKTLSFTVAPSSPLALPTPTELIQERASAVASELLTLASQQAEQRKKLFPNLDSYHHSTEHTLCAGFFQTLSQASDCTSLSRPMVEGSDMYACGFTASLALATFYAQARALAELEKQRYGDSERYQEMVKLDKLLAPLVASIDVAAELRDYQQEVDWVQVAPTAIAA